MSNVDINVDRRTDGRTDGRTENRTPISHPARSRCDKNIYIYIYSRLSLSRTSRDLIKMFELSVVRDNQIVTS